MKKPLTILLILMVSYSTAQEKAWYNSWVKFPTNQPVMTGNWGDWNTYMSCPTVIHDEGIFKMWFRGINLTNTLQQIGFAWSTDGINWNIHEDPVLPAVTPVFNCLIKGTGTVLRINDTLRMWYWAIFPGYVAKICYAWSVDDTTWHERTEPLLEAGEPGTWDEYDPWLNHVYYDAATNQYHMYYITSEVVTIHEEIGHATSPDGLNWERDTANPVIGLGPEGSFYDYRLFSGPLIFRNDTLHMFFSGYDGLEGDYHPSIGYAYSTDSPNWSEWTVGNNQQPVLTHGPPGSWDQKYTDLPAVLYHDGIYHMWYDGRPVSVQGRIGYAKQNVCCLPEGIGITTQAQIDNFPNNYPHCNEIKGELSIDGNEITNLHGLETITSIDGDLFIRRSEDLKSLTGVENLKSIEGNLVIGGFDFGLGTYLLNLTGLLNLNSIGGDLKIRFNSDMVDLSGLDHLKTIGGNIEIWWNPSLNNLTGLEYISASSIQDLTITDNSSLAICHVNSICNYLSTPGGTVEILNNAPGCNSQEEVAEACGLGIAEPSIHNNVITYPNPASGMASIKFYIENADYVTLKIYDVQGKEVATVVKEMLPAGEYKVSIDTRNYPSNIYFYRLVAGNTSVTGKLVVAK